MLKIFIGEIMIIKVVLHTIFMFFYLIVIIRIMGKREVGSLSVFDLAVYFTISDLITVCIIDKNVPLESKIDVENGKEDKLEVIPEKSFYIFTILILLSQLLRFPTGVFLQSFLYEIVNFMMKLTISYLSLNSQKPWTVLDP